VIGIELCPEAIENAKKNAQINGKYQINSRNQMGFQKSVKYWLFIQLRKFDCFKYIKIFEFIF
jgi:tRNA/tmRNA/rRNA uracil-C5-methylase (TrmA/RlmC/RlmD family)